MGLRLILSCRGLVIIRRALSFNGRVLQQQQHHNIHVIIITKYMVIVNYFIASLTSLSLSLSHAFSELVLFVVFMRH